MAQKKDVSGKTHTKQQLNDYANQHNPNNKAYKASVSNKQKSTKKNSNKDIGDIATLDWMCYSKGPYEFD